MSYIVKNRAKEKSVEMSRMKTKPIKSIVTHRSIGNCFSGAYIFTRKLTPTDLDDKSPLFTNLFFDKKVKRFNVGYVKTSIRNKQRTTKFEDDRFGVHEATQELTEFQNHFRIPKRVRVVQHPAHDRVFLL